MDLSKDHGDQLEGKLRAGNDSSASDASQVDRIDSTDILSSSSSVPSTRRSSITMASLEAVSRQLSSRTSFSSLQTSQFPDQTPAAIDLEDIQLQQICADEDKTRRFTSRPDRFADFVCAFGFSGKLDDLTAVPSTKKAFLNAVKAEQRAVGFIQQGLTSYITAINSGEHHNFSDDFLNHQNGAAETTIKQLHAINEHLIEVIDEVNEAYHPEHDDVEVKEDLRVAYGHARPWVQRTRAILVSAHVFYKINYVLASDKKI